MAGTCVVDVHVNEDVDVDVDVDIDIDVVVSFAISSRYCSVTTSRYNAQKWLEQSNILSSISYHIISYHQWFGVHY